MPADKYSLDTILQAELSDIGRQVNLVINRSYIATTATYTAPKVIQITTEIKKFKPSLFLKFIVSFYAAGLCSLLVLFFYKVKEKEAKDFLIFFTLLCLAIIIKLFVRFFINKSLDYTITLTNKGIEINNTFYQWKTIDETAILTKGKSRGTDKFLILLFKETMSYKKFNLKNFASFGINNFSENLALYIEYFKGQDK